jgi:hypothetical protein
VEFPIDDFDMRVKIGS